jgi:putative MATE family efflux protein
MLLFRKSADPLWQNDGGGAIMGRDAIISKMEKHMASLFSRRDTDMTTGGIAGHLVSFAMPLLIGNIFQQLYNTVDSIVVGNFVGKEALAAVGSVSPVINTLIGFFLGLATGGSVVISQYYGARDEKGVHEAVHTTLAMTFILCVVFTAVGAAVVPYMLRMMSTPEDVYAAAEEYLRIYFYGASGLLIYNMGSGILRAVGDSRRPLYFLIFSAAVNTVLDLVFVISFGWGVAGVAIATVTAQALSAVLVLIVLTRTQGMYRVLWRRVRLHGRTLRTICAIGMPPALQQAVTSFSNVFVQAYINQFGSACMAGWTSYGKIDQFALLPSQAIALSTTTFVGQNLGAGNVKRARQGLSRAMAIAFVATAVLITPLMIFPRQLISMFNTDPEVLGYGELFIRVISPFYLLCAVNQNYSGALSGAGDTLAPMAIMLGSFVVFRQIYLFITSRLVGTLLPVALGYPVGWVLCSIAIVLYYHSGRWEKRRVVVSPRAQAGGPC